MKRMVMVGLLVCVVGGAWHIAGRLSSDAVGMAVGLFFGVAAGVPAAALVLLAGRRHRLPDADRDGLVAPQHLGGSRYGQPQMPVIVVAAPPYMGAGPAQGQAGFLPQTWQPPGPAAPADQRSFRIVGESDQAMDEW